MPWGFNVGKLLESRVKQFKGIATMKPMTLPGCGLGVFLLLLTTTASSGEDVPIGWASVDGGTTGGHGGAVVTVSDASSLVAQAESKLPLIIRVSGTIHLTSPVRVKSNKTIVGIGPDATIQGGGIFLTKVSNIIIRNLTITGATDAINVEGAAHHIWVDHCDLSKCTDGLLDIKHGSDLITVSWNHFHDHHKTCLLGHSDKDDVRQIDTGHLRVTYHHNFFDGTQDPASPGSLRRAGPRLQQLLQEQRVRRRRADGFRRPRRGERLRERRAPHPHPVRRLPRPGPAGGARQRVHQERHSRRCAGPSPSRERPTVIRWTSLPASRRASGKARGSARSGPGEPQPQKSGARTPLPEIRAPDPIKSTPNCQRTVMPLRGTLNP